ncbi:recombinase family protein [Spirillospora sp. NPDC029432]|uniref:recombinase family protein n=1 Tax=Spirillospora sp. NPDC029432 TaxID=3154599 RepID=UPI0034546AF9
MNETSAYTETVRAAVYVRQSAARASGSEASPATQRDAGRAEAERRGAASVEMYEDIGISAFRDVERPDFERMLADCRAGRRNVIIVYYVSRFSRKEITDAIPIVTELLQLGVTIVSVTEGEFRRGNLMDLIHLIMRLDAAHAESKNKSRAIRDAQAKAREYGGYVGGKPTFGLKLVAETVTMNDGRPLQIQRLAVNEDEAPTVKEAWARIKAHMNESYNPGAGRRHPGSLTGICADFNERGIPTRGRLTGNKTAKSHWEPKTLAGILRDPRIAGYAATPVYHFTESGRKTSRVIGHRIERDETGMPITTHEAIIHPAEWWVLQKWLDSRGRGKGTARGKALLSGIGLLFCECGHTMKSHGNTVKTVKSTYRCTRRRGVSEPGQHAGTCAISQPTVDEYVARRVFALIETAEGDAETLAILAEATRRFGRTVENPEIAGERTALVGQRAETLAALNELYEDKAAGGYKGPRGRAAFIAEESALMERLEAADARLTELDAISSPTLPISSWLERNDPSGDPLGSGSWWERATLTERQGMVRLFVARVTVAKSEIPHGRYPAGQSASDRVTVEWVQPDTA